MIGETVGNYKVIAQLGEGGMGLVYLAEHPLIGSKVAIKVLHPELANNPEVVSRFFTEARSVNDIRHPNIVEIADFGNKDGRCYIVMEFLEGDSLAARMRRVGCMDDATAARIAMHVAAALGAAHERGIVHRDLKPDNVFLTKVQGQPDGVRVLDFGVAKLIGDPFETSHRTQTGVIIGTPYYMSPEQCLAKKDLDGRSDIYALGTLLYELVTGTVPFSFESLGELIVAHTSQEPVPPTERNPRVSPELSQIILRTLRKDPGERFATMAELIEALSPIAGQTPSGMFVPPLAQTMPPTGAAAPAPTAPLAPTTLSSAAGSRDIDVDDVVPARSRTPLLVGGAVLLGAAAVVGVIMTGGGNDTEGGDATRPTTPTTSAAAADRAPEPLSPPTLEPEPVEPASSPVVVTATPEAELFVEDVNLGTTPVTVDVPADRTSIAIELRAKGYETKRIDVTADSGTEIAVVLDKAKRTATKTARRRPNPSADDDEDKAKTKKNKKKTVKKSSFTVKPIE